MEIASALVEGLIARDIAWAGDFEDWLFGVLDDGDEVVSDDLWRWGERLMAIGLPASVETDARLVLGEVAAFADQDSATLQGASAPTTTARESLRNWGLHPPGTWEAELLSDQLLGSLLRHADWSALDPEGASATHLGELTDLLVMAEALMSSRRVSVRRSATAIAAVCASRVGEADKAGRCVQQFFAIDRQCRREGARPASEAEVMMVGLAGAALVGDGADPEAVHELTRQLKTVGSEPGEPLPFALQTIVARAYLRGDPAYSQMLAKALLDDIISAIGETSDDALSAAFILLEASLAAGDVELADELVNTWMPRAIEVGHGAGAAAWMERLELDDDGDE